MYTYMYNKCSVTPNSPGLHLITYVRVQQFHGIKLLSTLHARQSERWRHK